MFTTTHKFAVTVLGAGALLIGSTVSSAAWGQPFDEDDCSTYGETTTCGSTEERTTSNRTERGNQNTVTRTETRYEETQSDGTVTGYQDHERMEHHLYGTASVDRYSTRSTQGSDETGYCTTQERSVIVNGEPRAEKYQEKCR